MIQDVGSNYDAGSYTEVPVLGGTGDNALLDIVVVPWSGAVTQEGKNYTAGSNFTGIALTGGNGTGATCNFVVPALDGVITNGGSAYAPAVYLSLIHI